MNVQKNENGHDLDEISRVHFHDLSDTYIKGNMLSDNRAYISINFIPCYEETFCASPEEILEYFDEKDFRLLLLVLENYVDFKNHENPIQGVLTELTYPIPLRMFFTS